METIIASEAILALYPILVKRVNTNLITQLLSRLGTFTILSAILATPKDWFNTWGSPSAAIESSTLGIMNLIHIASSYISYYNLPAGTALSIFYLYPLFNVVAGSIFFGDKISLASIPFFLLAILGVYLLTYEKREEPFTDTDQQTSSRLLGVFAALVSALTETLIYVAVKNVPGPPNIHIHHLHLYAGGFLALLAAVFAGKTEPVDLKPATWSPLLLFNILVGYIGYSLRFYIIPQTKIGLFSILSFVGVIAAFIWGYLFADERPGIHTVAGSACILGAIAGYSLV